MEIFDRNKADIIKNILSLETNKIKLICKLIKKTSFKNNIFCIGNGGSASISNHFVCDLVKGSNYDKKYKMISLSDNIEIITAISNDISYEEIFTFQLSKYANKNDLLIAISSSGKSKNIVKALQLANKMKLNTISLTGFNGGNAKKISNININVNSDNYGVIEDTHSFIMHSITQILHNE